MLATTVGGHGGEQWGTRLFPFAVFFYVFNMLHSPIKDSLLLVDALLFKFSSSRSFLSVMVT